MWTPLDRTSKAIITVMVVFGFLKLSEHGIRSERMISIPGLQSINSFLYRAVEGFPDLERIEENEEELSLKVLHINAKQMERYRVSQPPIFDGVIIGDSRVFRIFPSILIRYRPELKFFNLGCPGISFNANYFNNATRILNPRSKQRIIIVGISAMSLTNSPTRKKHLIKPSESARMRVVELIRKRISLIEKESSRTMDEILYDLEHGACANKASKIHPPQ